MPPEASAQRWAGFVWVAAGLLVFAYLRARLSFSDLGNADIAGILYNADVILAGELPYVATTEIKGPGAFFAVAAVFASFGREFSVLQIFYSSWLLLGAPAVWIAARHLWPDHPASRGCAVALWLWGSAQFEMNYASWMTVPYVWSFASALAAASTGKRGWAMGTGAFAAMALIFKHQAVVLLPLLLWVGWRRCGLGRSVAVAVGLWAFVGVATVLVPLVVVYSTQGALGALMDALLARDVAPVYAHTEVELVALFPAVAMQQITTFPLAMVAAMAGLLLSNKRESSLWIFYGLSVLACGLGGWRFYPHYTIQVLPALALLAASPALLSALVEDVGRWWVRPLLRVVLGLTLVWQGIEMLRGTAHRFDPLPRFFGDQSPAQAAGAHIQARTSSTDTVQAWGWHAWPIYYWAHRRAPTPIYKELGVLTDYNTNTIVSASQPIHFREGPIAEEFLAKFKAAPPAYFVYADSAVGYFGSPTEPLVEFKGLWEFLRDRYVIEARFAELEVWVRSDRLEAASDKRVLVTGFNDWKDLGEPPDVWRCRDNPSCRLLVGSARTGQQQRFDGELPRRLNALSSVDWSFATMPVTWDVLRETDPLTQYDVTVHVGLGVYDRDDQFLLERGAWNGRRGADAAGSQSPPQIDPERAAILRAPEGSEVEAHLNRLDGQQFGRYTLQVADARSDNSFLCNETHWRALEALEQSRVGAGRLSAVYFLHIPYARAENYAELAEAVAGVVVALTD